MNDFTAEPEALKQATYDSIKAVLDSGWYVLGDQVKNFERSWAEICGTKYAIGVGNGLDAIEIILRSLGVGSGDEVITTPMTAFATVLAIQRCGATPVLADIDSSNAILSVEGAAKVITTKTRAIMLVHLYGRMIDMTPWRDLCEDKGLQLIEDCAQAHLASFDGKVAGSAGIAGAYSFYPTKNLGALGDAGMIVTDNADIDEISRRLRNYGQSERYHHSDAGMNSRLDEFQAAILQTRLAWLRGFTARRRIIAERYHRHITNSLVKPLPEAKDPANHSYHLFVITCQNRDALVAYLSSAGIQTLIHYPILTCDQPAFGGEQYSSLPNSRQHAATCLSIPCHPQLSDADVTLVINALNEYQG